MSYRLAAAHYGVAASTAIRWHDRERTEGHGEPKRPGGDRRSDRIESQAATILGLIEAKPDMTLAEIQAALEERGIGVAVSTI
jgi:transposase